MKVYSRMLALFSFLFLLIGCVPQSTIIPNVPQTYKTDYAQIWTAAVDSIDELGFTAAQMNKEEGYITTSKQDAEAVYGQMSVAEMALLMIPKERVKVTIRLSKEDTGTRVKVTPFIERFNSQSIMASKWSEVESNGTLEKKIYESIGSKLNSL